MTPEHADPMVTAWLAERDAACPVCDYNLRGVELPVCPECASPLQLAVASPGAVHGPWVFAIVSLAMGLGFDAVMVVLFVSLRLYFGPTPGPFLLIFVSVFLCLAVACASPMVWTIRTRRRWFQRARSSQWRRAWAIFLLVGAVHTVVGLSFFALIL